MTSFCPILYSNPGQQPQSGLIHSGQRQEISLPGKAWVGIGLAVLTLTTWHFVTLMQDIPAVASACWDWLYITVPGLLSFLLRPDQSTNNNRGIEKDNMWLQMDKRSINYLYTGLWLLYRWMDQYLQNHLSSICFNNIMGLNKLTVRWPTMSMPALVKKYTLAMHNFKMSRLLIWKYTLKVP